VSPDGNGGETRCGQSQRQVLRDDVAIRTDFPARLKVLTAHRFGVSTVTRMG
jgi:hypothetical protein